MTRKGTLHEDYWFKPKKIKNPPKEFINNFQDYNYYMEEYKDKLIILYFWFKWGEACANLKPLLKEISEEFEDKVKILKIDCDNTNTFYLMDLYKVLCSPTFVFIKNKSKIGTFVAGFKDAKKNCENLKKYILEKIFM